ncbi:MAG: hypothetical protein ACTSW1_11650 [Candidatus Hodarchaeales archaeon]
MMMFNGFENNMGVNKQKDEQEFKKLKEYVRENNDISEHDLTAIWHEIKHMRSELDIADNISSIELYNYYCKLIIIKKAFSSQVTNFPQLNQLYIELTTIREMLNLPDTMTTPKIIELIRSKKISELGIGTDSLLEKLLSVSFYK